MNSISNHLRVIQSLWQKRVNRSAPMIGTASWVYTIDVHNLMYTMCRLSISNSWCIDKESIWCLVISDLCDLVFSSPMSINQFTWPGSIANDTGKIFSRVNNSIPPNHLRGCKGMFLEGHLTRWKKSYYFIIYANIKILLFFLWFWRKMSSTVSSQILQLSNHLSISSKTEFYQ